MPRVSAKKGDLDGWFLSCTLEVRVDDPGENPRYTYVSSSQHGRPTPVPEYTFLFAMSWRRTL